MKASVVSFLLVLTAPQNALAQVSGQAFGFARGVTGGGSATPAVPSSVQQYAPESEICSAITY